MNALRRTPFYAATVGAVLALMPLQAAEVSPALKKNADILQTILQTAFKDNENSRLSSLQYSYLTGQGLLFQASSGGRHIFQFRNMSIPSAPVAPVPPLPGGEFEFEFDTSDIEKITLINNAGTLGKIGRIEAIDDIAQTVALNTIAPLLLTSTFIRLTKNWQAVKHIINISSGAAHKPYYGWTVYCATKAAIDMMTKTIALEQEAVPNGVKILAVYPGVVDTQMQAKIRESDKASFPSIDRFLDLKSTNSLANATTVGKQIYDIDHDDAIENGSILRVKE